MKYLLFVLMVSTFKINASVEDRTVQDTKELLITVLYKLKIA
jgi:hypothetical protein